MPRLVGQLVSYLPLADAAVPYALGGAGIAALCALFIYHAMDGWVWSPWLRALAGVALILLPLAPIEIADSAVGAPWYVLTALFFALLWRPKNWAGMTAAALVAFAAASSEILAVIYAPLVLLRLVALPRWREHAVTAGWLAGLLVQMPVVLETYVRHTQRLRSLARPVQSLGFYFHHVALRALGWRVSVRLVEIAGLNGATVIVCAILVAGLCWALVTGSRQSRVFVAVALITGFVQSVVAAALVPVVIRQQYQVDFEGGSRYAAMPIMAMTAAAVVAVDACLRRQASAEGGDRNALIRKSPRALAAVAVLACVLALSWVLDYRYVTQRMALPQLVAAACQVGGLGGVARQLDGFVIRRARLLTAAQPAQQVGAGRMVEVIAGQPVLKTVDGRQCHLGTVKLGDRDSPVEGDDRRGVEADELVVEGDVGEYRLLTAVVDDGGRAGHREATGEDPVTLRLEPVVEHVDGSLLLRCAGVGRVVDHGNHVLHLGSSPVVRGPPWAAPPYVLQLVAYSGRPAGR